MTEARPPSFPLIAFFASGLIAIGALRWATLNLEEWNQFAELPTPAFIVLTVLVGIRVMRGHGGWGAVGLGDGLRPLPHISLGLVAAAIAILAGNLLEPVWIQIFGAGRNLDRFEGAATLPGLLAFLALTWTVAAFGEELAFRGILMKGLARVFGGSRGALLLALLLQAIVFGLVHAYQGPGGMAAVTVSGLVFGGAVLAGRGSLWPAILAHGFTNTYGLVSLYVTSG